MKKIWAVINLSAEETAQPILSALFSKEEFNPSNAILIEEKMVITEIFFEEIPPQKIVEAIGGYHNIRCGFGEVSEECLKKVGKSSEEVYNKKVDENDAPAETANQVVANSSEQESEASTEAVAEDFVDAVSIESFADDKGESVSDEVIAEKNEESVSTEAVEVKNEESSSEPTDKVGEELFHNESDSGSSEEVPYAEPTVTTEVSPTEPTEKISEDVPSAVTAVKSGRSKPRKAPEHIRQIDDIAQKCASYEQFTSEVAKWLEVGKLESYVVDLFKVAVSIEKLSWTPIEKELAKKGYSNPFAMRQRTSSDVTKKLAKENIDCSFIALVKYVSKHKVFDSRSYLESKVKQILLEMGIENEEPELQSQITNIAIKAVMVDLNNANMKHICTEAGYGKDEDDILDAKMNFSNFVNKFLKKQGLEMTTAEDFVGRLRETVYNGTSIC